MYRIIKVLLKIFPRPFLIKMSLIVHKFVAFFMRGNKVSCPICEGNFRKFLPYGYVKKRDNALCPGCLSLERHRLLWLFLKEHTNFFNAEELKVLHIAPEQCFIGRFKKMKNLDYTTGDLESPIVDVKMDVCDIPFEDEAFDVVICNHVLEHVNDDNRAMKEFYRVMKNDGMGIFQVPLNIKSETTDEDSTITDRAERERRFGQYDHVRYYGMDYFDRLKSVGFTINNNAKQYLNNMCVNDLERKGIILEDILPIVKK
jgi:SAM-dependent methyltransferase